jgi:hypothetical protein
MRDFAYEDLDQEAIRELEANEKYEAQCFADDAMAEIAAGAPSAKDEAAYLEDMARGMISDPRALAASWMKGCLEQALKDKSAPAAVKAYIATILGRWCQACPEMKK